MKKALAALFSSRKFLVALATALAAAGGKLGLELDTETIILILSPMIALIAGIAVEDVGKGKEMAKVEGAKAGVDSASVSVDVTEGHKKPRAKRSSTSAEG